MAVSYRGLDFGKLKTEAARIDERAANRANGSNRKPFPKEAFYNLDAGDHDIRILPPGYGDVDYVTPGKMAMLVFDHNNVPGDVVNPKTGRKDKYRCPRATYPELGISCPICAALSELWEWFKAAGLTDAEQKAKKSNYYMRRKAYVNAIVRGDKTLRDLEYNGEILRAPKVRIIGMPVAAIYEPLVQATRLRRAPLKPSTRSAEPDRSDSPWPQRRHPAIWSCPRRSSRLRRQHRGCGRRRGRRGSDCRRGSGRSERQRGYRLPGRD